MMIFLVDGMLTTDCAPLCWSQTVNGFGYSTHPIICNSSAFVFDDNVGYAMTVYVPGISEIIYEMYSNTTRNTILVYGSNNLANAERAGYMINSLFFVAIQRVVNTMVKYILLSGTSNFGDPKSFIAIYNSKQHLNYLATNEWNETFTFFLFSRFDSNASMCRFSVGK